LFSSRGYRKLTYFAALSLITAIFAVYLPVAAAVEVTATRLDGSTTAGELRSWSDESVVIVSSAGEQKIPAAELLNVRWSPQAVVAEKPMAGSAELVDGTQIPFSDIQTNGGNAALVPETGSPTKQLAVALPVASLAAIRLQRLDPALVLQWDEIRRQKLVSDVLVVLKRDGKSLDYVEGIVGNIAGDKVEFKLDGETSRVDRAKIAGIIYYRSAPTRTAEARMTLRGKSGFRTSVARLEQLKNVITLTTIGGTKLRWPAEDIELADFSAGKVMYLSDIEPATKSWSPLVGLPDGLNLADAYGEPHLDRSMLGKKLSVRVKDLPASETDAATSQAVERVFNKGLALRSRTELVYRVPAGFRRFQTVAGIDPAAAAVGDADLAIFADDRPLLETQIAGNQPALSIDVEITGARRLKIVVDFGQNLDTGDWVNLCDAKIVK
jgi:hypothetical protein